MRTGDMYRRYVSPILFVIVSALVFLVPAYLLPGHQERGRVPAGHVPFPSAVAVAQDITDDLGRPFARPARPPERIVSMAPNVTEILFAIGLGGRVAGVTRFCDYPPEARHLPRIGGLVDPNIEIVRSLDPDLVIAFRGNPLRLVERIGKLGLPVFVLDIGAGLEDLPPLVARIGRITGTEARAGELAAELRDRIQAVDAALKGIASKPKVFVMLYGQGLWTCGGESYLDDVIARAGGTNVASALPKKWALYKRERIIRDDPDIVFILARSTADFETGRAWLAGMAGIGAVSAVRSGRVYELDEDAASRFGPRLVDVLDRMAALLHPERFGGEP
ncbi:MAG: ABC transporter substrate-binding protein [Candidatus Aminicenantes bacterium]|nr:ABC transporter substrate-binding protein [Candidatus Aminicenantes bacterium]